MKNYIALVSVLGTMLLAGCAGAVPKAAEPASAVSLTSAELAASELAPSPYTVDAPSTFSAEDDALLPDVRHPAPLPMDDASSASLSVPRTWGAAGSSPDYGF
jgi:hypothetical protein